MDEKKDYLEQKGETDNIFKSFTGKVNKQVKSFFDFIPSIKLPKMKNGPTMILSFVIVILIMFNLGLNIYFNMERKKMFQSYYYISDELKNKVIMTPDEKKRNFQMKVIGFLKEIKSDLTDQEMIAYTDLVFTKTEQYGIDNYLPVAVAWYSSGLKKGNTGLYRMMPIIGSLASSLAGINYYSGIELNVVDSTKMFLEYYKVIADRFQGDANYSLIYYDIKDEEKIIKYAALKIDKVTGLIDISGGNKKQLKRLLYQDKSSYDVKILKITDYIKNINLVSNDIEDIKKIFEVKEEKKK